jgi:hypothetical protein
MWAVIGINDGDKRIDINFILGLAPNHEEHLQLL